MTNQDSASFDFDEPITRAAAWTPADPILAQAIALISADIAKEDLIPDTIIECRNNPGEAKVVITQLLNLVHPGGGDIDEKRFKMLTGPNFLEASVHTDLDFNRYFILFTATGGEGHLEWWSAPSSMGNEKTANYTEKKSPTMTLPFQPGQMMVFDAHRPHGSKLSQPGYSVLNKIREVVIKGWTEQSREKNYHAYLDLCEANGWSPRMIQRLSTHAITTESADPISAKEAEKIMSDDIRINAYEYWEKARLQVEQKANSLFSADQKQNQDVKKGNSASPSAATREQKRRWKP